MTVLDLDFTQQPSQQFNADGNFTIAGLSVTKVHSAAEVVHAQIINGTGLRFQPSGGSNYDQGLGNISGPWIWIPLSQLPLPANFNWGSSYRIFISLGANTNFAANFDGCFFGLGDVNSTVLASAQNIGESGGGLSCFFSGRWGTATWSTGQSANTQLTAVHQTTLPPDVSTMSYTGTLTPGTAFPPASSFSNPAIQTNTENGNQATLAISQLGLFVGAKRAGSGTALIVDVQRIRLDLLASGF